MSAYDGAAFVFPFLLVGAVGRVELKGFFHVLVSSPAVFLGLTFLEDVSSHDICVDGEVGHQCDSLSDFLALVVASLPLAVGASGMGMIPSMSSKKWTFIPSCARSIPKSVATSGR